MLSTVGVLITTVVTGLLMELMRLLTRGGTIDVVTGVNDFALYSGPIVDG